MNKTIKYIGFYDFPVSNNKRASNLAATNKMEYVCSAIVRAGYKIHIVSPSWIINRNKRRFEKQHTVRVDNNISVTFFPSWKTSSKTAMFAKIIFTLNWLLLYLLLRTRKNEAILVYHSPWLSVPIRTAKFFKKFKLILEVEEIYGKVWKNRKILNFMEKNILSIADNYIIVSNSLVKILGIPKSIILYGSYEYMNRGEKDTNKNENINIVYAGSIDTTRNAAFNIVETAKYLRSNYVINILGFGDMKQMQKLEKQISAMNNILKRKACLYNGVKTGKELTDFLHFCHIGINPQNSGNYMDTAFPSKILTYLLHNLRVVSTPVKSVVESCLSDIITFADSDSPEDIAKAIMSVDVNKPYNSRARIKQLDEEFVSAISKLLKGNR